MRWLRFVLPIAIIVVLAAVGKSYFEMKRVQEQRAPKPPMKVDRPQAQKWRWRNTDGDRLISEVQADRMEQLNDGSQLQLQGLELKMFHKKGDPAYDKVVSAKATYNTSDGVLYSEGDVEITLGVPDEGPPRERLVKISSSGVRYESKTGKATTDRPASFVFDRGEGKSVGAEYDPKLKELHMRKDVELHWKGVGPKGKTMTVQAGELIYRESESKVLLMPWSRLIRDTLTLNGAASVVSLNEGVIRKVESSDAQGTDEQPNRHIQYAAKQMTIDFDEDGEIKTINGNDTAKLTSTSDISVTDMAGDHVVLDFDTSSGSSVLTHTLAMGKSEIISKPVVRQGVTPGETKVLHSEVINMQMKPGGQYLETVKTDTPGTLEFLPNAPGQRKRKLHGERMTMTYGDRNELQQFRSSNVATQTENEPKKGQKGPVPPSLTWSKDLLATFDPKTGQMTRLEQWQDFRYQEGVRQAKADRAVLEQTQDLMTLEGKARTWDDTGSTSADKILMNQKTNETNAEGNVVSVRLPDQDQPGKKKKKDDGSLLAKDQPMQAKALRMTSSENNKKLHYEGNAIVWQGVNRVQADKIDINRKESTLEAHGHVISQFVEKNQGEETPAPRKSIAPVFTVIKAPEMLYTDQDKQAFYQGGVIMNRPGMDVKSEKLRAFLRQDSEDDDSSLDHAFADGKVEIFQRSPQRTKQGFGEHAEYYVDEEKVFLEGGQPQLIDSLKGITKGKQLTYYSNEDRLLVDGAPAQPATSRLNRHK